MLNRVNQSLVNFIYESEPNQMKQPHEWLMNKFIKFYIVNIENELQKPLDPVDYKIRMVELENYRRWMIEGSLGNLNIPHPFLRPQWIQQLEKDLSIKGNDECPNNFHTILEEYFTKRDSGVAMEHSHWKEFFQEKASCINLFKKLLPILGNDHEDWPYQMILIHLWYVKITEMEGYLLYNQALKCNLKRNLISFGNLLYFLICRDCNETSLLKKLEKDMIMRDNHKGSLRLGNLWSKEAFELPITEFGFARLCDEFQGRFPDLGKL
ncbi:MAG: hypothetical protein HOP11_10775 [Saprospiraceae bacterium]|nr:hypothetical protein [Saprospiraceae bacterium]